MFCKVSKCNFLCQPGNLNTIALAALADASVQPLLLPMFAKADADAATATDASAAIDALSAAFAVAAAADVHNCCHHCLHFPSSSCSLL
jgi:hypothetical protein